MATWLEDIKQVFTAAGGEMHYSDLYSELGRIRGRELSRNNEATVRKEVERFSSHSDNWKEGRPDLFRSTRGKGKGFWSLAKASEQLKIAPDIEGASILVDAEPPERREYVRELTLRNSRPILALKKLYGGRCQVSGELVMDGIAGDLTEAHHIRWLMRGGLDVEANIVVLSPTFHAAIHAVDANFDWASLTFIVSGKRFPLLINKHLVARTAPQMNEQL